VRASRSIANCVISILRPAWTAAQDSATESYKERPAGAVERLGSADLGLESQALGQRLI
jgi:hypothetical protein